MSNKTVKAACALGLLSVAGPALAQAPSLGTILSMHSTPAEVAAQSSSPIAQARSKAVYAAAETYAAQSAYCHQAAKLKRWLDTPQETKVLNEVYSFANLLLDGGRVLPPVIQQVDASYVQKGDDLAVTARTTWHILRQARIVSAAPDWRDYLYIQCAPPLKRNPILLPGGINTGTSPRQASSGGGSELYDSSHTTTSVATSDSDWARGARAGWKLGTEEATDAFDLGLHRLNRDYTGMFRFWWLSRRGVVSTPILARGHVGIRVNGHTLSVGETVFRLTQGATWNHQSLWRPVIQPTGTGGAGN